MDITNVNLDTFHDELDQSMARYAAGDRAGAIRLMEAYVAKLDEFIAAAERFAAEQDAKHRSSPNPPADPIP